MLHNVRTKFYIFLFFLFISNIFGIYFFSFNFLYNLIIFAPIALLGIYDILQKKHAILRNFPVLGHLRYFFESIRPEIHQYFIESDTNGRPVPRDFRSVVYQRSKRQLDTRPFGSKVSFYRPGYEWANHSLKPYHVDPSSLRVKIGGTNCKLPYNASILNISAMSYGSLSANAVLALNGGAFLGGFAHNTGEGAISPYHEKRKGDLIWQIGTGYFGCRDKKGRFDKHLFAKKSQSENVKMIEIKLSQGAKPGHGGILPASKNNEEIAQIRCVKPNTTIFSPGVHKAFSNPIELCHFITQLQELSGGKPVGIKLCIGKRREFISICKAMLETGVKPDFITVDGAEGGTGAAPQEFQDHIGSPLRDGLLFTHNTLKGFGFRKEIKIIASGGIITAFDIVQKIAIGADLCSSARAMMLALGCIQALQCNQNICPTGVTTHNPNLTVGLVPKEKEKRVFNYHKYTLESVAEVVGTMGISKTEDLRPWHILRRGRTGVQNYGELFEYLEEGSLLNEPIPKKWKNAMKNSSAKTFSRV